MLAIQNPPFVEFLKARLSLTEEELPEPGEWADAGNTIGMLSLRMGLLTVEQIDHILELQEQEGKWPAIWRAGGVPGTFKSRPGDRGSWPSSRSTANWNWASVLCFPDGSRHGN